MGMERVVAPVVEVPSVVVEAVVEVVVDESVVVVGGAVVSGTGHPAKKFHSVPSSGAWRVN